VARLEPRDHTISLKTAAAYTKAHRGSLKTKEGGADHGGAFHADQVMKLLQQKGCAALRVYHAKNEKGEKAMVLVGVDATGKDMTQGIMMELCWPCPPFCDPDSALVK
jgi:hypothetical protein